MKFLVFLFVAVIVTCFEIVVVVVSGFTLSRRQSHLGSSSSSSSSSVSVIVQQQQQQQQQKRVLMNTKMTPKPKLFNGSPTVLFNSGIDGTSGRGPIIFGLILLVNVWIFTIPTEFRRAYICPTESCVSNRSACKDCQTFDELKEGIISYYKNGGGIQFDFSIDPGTIAQNEQTIQGILRK